MLIEYPLHFLSDDEFEYLVVDVCRDVLGIGVVQFTKGRDGGKDGRVECKAISFPSTNSPWEGKFIIQSKHTKNPIGSCSDSDFNTIINDEIPRIKKLKENGEVDNYIIFTNRSVTGGKDTEIIGNIKTNTKVENVDLVGKSTLNSHLLDNNDLVKKYQLDLLMGPLRFFDEDLKDVIIQINQGLTAIPKEEIQTLLENFDFISKKEKNEKNKLSEEFFNNIKENDLPYFNQISTFLNDPKNREILESYENTVIELNNKITARRDEYGKFEDIINYLFDYIFNKYKIELKKMRRLIYTLLNFMYYNCDLGQK